MAYISKNNDDQKMERRIAALNRHREGESFRSIAADFNCSPQTIANDVAYMLDMYQAPAVETYRKMLLEQNEAQLVRMQAKLAKPQFVTSAKGDVVRHPETGEPLIDEEYQLKVEDRISRLLAERAKLMGAYAPAQLEVQHTETTQMDLEVAGLLNAFKAKQQLKGDAVVTGDASASAEPVVVQPVEQQHDYRPEAWGPGQPG